MKYTDFSNKSSTLGRWITATAAASFLALGLAGCGGSSSSSTSSGTSGGGGTSTADVTAAITAAAAVTTNDTATTPTAAFSVVNDAGVAPVTVNSPPKVNFTVISDGAVKKDLTLSNVAFIIARLDKGTNGSPDQWVSYTTRTETATAGVGPGGTPALASATQATTDTEAENSLVYNEAGYYTYTFSTDITADAGYDPTKTHRVAIQLSYTNAANETVLANPYFDFTIGSDGKAVAVTDTSADRKVVDISSCNECHEKLALHGGGRIDTQYCVLCHNAGTTDANSGNVLDFRTMVHKIHAGEHVKEWFGKDYTIWGYRDSEHDYAEVTYPQLLTNCTKCHDGTNPKTPQGDNYKNVPSRAACGTCHAGINFDTGTGATIADAEADVTAGNPVGTTKSGHVGKAQANDQACTLCHGAAAIVAYHVTVDPTGSAGRGGYMGKDIPLAAQMNLPEGAYKINYEIKQVTVSSTAGARQATVVYRVLKDGAPVTFNDTGYLIDDVDGTPSIYIAYAVPQDGNTAPADWNGTKNDTLSDIRDGLDGNSQTGPDADGYYTATLGAIIPDDAKHITAAIGVNYNGFVQLNLDAYPDGLRIRDSQFVMKVADDEEARRSIVSNAKCNNCHAQLGVGPSFHSGARNNGEGCAICHDPNRATGHGGGWSVSVKNMVHAIHGASKREQDFSYEATAANPKGFGIVTYPGILKDCETCHVAGSYDFSGTLNASQASKMLWTTDAKYDESASADLGLSPWLAILGNGKADYTNDNLVSSPIASACFGCHDTQADVAHMQSQGGTLVSQVSTVATGSDRTAAGFRFTKLEACLVCHGTGKPQDIKVMHAQ